MVADGLERYSDERFKMTFRISRETFNYILNRIREEIECKCTSNIEEATPPEVKLAVALYRFAKGDYYYTISKLTGLGVATVCNFTIEVSKAIVNSLWDDHVLVHFPKTQH